MTAIPAHARAKMDAMITVSPDVKQRPNPRCPSCGELLYDVEQVCGPLTFYTEDGKTVVVLTGTQTMLEFTNAEAAIMSVLAHAGGRVVSKNKLFDTLYWQRGEDDVPTAKLIDVYVCKIRKKLIKFSLPIAISTMWGRGYAMVVDAGS